MHPLLRPGTHVLRRSASQLQVGLLPDQALVLPDTPAVRHTLRLLGSATDEVGPVDPATVAALRSHDRLLDRRDLPGLLAGDDVARGSAAATARTLGSAAPTAQRLRSRSRVEVVPFGPPSIAERLGQQLAGLLSAAGLRTAPVARRAAPARRPTVGLLVGAGEPERELLDAWTRTGTPHAVLRLVEGAVLLGPFVVPGRTACLRCADAHLTDADPAWPVLLRLYSHSVGRPDALPEPVDPLLGTLGLAWLARDVSSYVDGRRPSTWSASVSLHPELASITTRRFLRHPACGCCWDESLASSRTMEA